MGIQSAVGLAALAIATLALMSQHLPITNHVVLLTATASPYLMLCTPVSAWLLFLARRWFFAIVAAGLTVVTLAVQLSSFLGLAADGTTGVALRVMSANLREGAADPESLVRSAREQADVLAFQELTAQEVARLTSAGLDATFPYRWLDPRDGAAGVGIWSRLPLHTTKRIDGFEMALVTAQIDVADTAIDPTVVAVHVPGPWPQPIGDWMRDLDQLPSVLREAAESTGGAVIVAGDFNSTTNMRPFRDLLIDGYRDAVEQSGAGIEPTFPANSPLPPFVAIDHILTHDCAATSLHTVEVPGSDHLAVVAAVTIPRSAAGF